MNRSWSKFIVLFILAFKVVAAEKPTAADITFFEEKIRPVLVKKCFECHSADSKESKTKLMLDAPVADAALITKALRSAGEKTPHHKPLPEQVIRDFEKWVKLGAPFPPIAEAVADESLWASQPIT